ncbi:MAG: SCO family protein [Acidobacteriaceae bacterium]
MIQVVTQAFRRFRLPLALALLTFLAPNVYAQKFWTGREMQQVPVNKNPKALEGVGIDQKLNAQVPLDIPFVDAQGQPVELKQYFGKRPVVLSLVYYDCPMLCPQTLQGITEAIKQTTLKLGSDYEIVTVSFNPKETPAIAAAAKKEWLGRLGNPAAEQAWHFLTGNQESITKLANAVGFHYKWDPQTNQFNHATAIMVVTPKGKLSKYFYGVVYSPRDLRLGLIQAADNKIGTAVDAILLFCCKYDVGTGKYDVLVSRVLSIAGAITIVVLGSFLLFLAKYKGHRPAAG